MDPMLPFEPAFHTSRALTIPKVVHLPVIKMGQSNAGWKDPGRSFLSSAARRATVGQFFTLFEFPGSPQAENPLTSARRTAGLLSGQGCMQQAALGYVFHNVHLAASCWPLGHGLLPYPGTFIVFLA